jgi:hypothetical protein
MKEEGEEEGEEERKKRNFDDGRTLLKSAADKRYCIYVCGSSVVMRWRSGDERTKMEKKKEKKEKRR